MMFPSAHPASPLAATATFGLKKSELPPADSGEGDMHLTEEINLDEEILKRQEEEKDKPSTKLKAKSELKLPTTSPFELSDSDLEMPSEFKESGVKTPKQAKSDPADSSDFDLAAQGAKPEDDSSDFDLGAQGAKKDDSSDFDLAPAEDGTVNLDGASSSDFSLEVSDDSEHAIHDDGNTELTSATSGLTLNNPADEGISLEEGQDSSDFDLSLEPEESWIRGKGRKNAEAEEKKEASRRSQRQQRIRAEHRLRCGFPAGI